MSWVVKLLGARSGSAAAEMALVLPLLLILFFGSFEIGNYFRSEHVLVKAVRDGARYAARQDFSNYAACTGAPTGSVVQDTRNLIQTGLLSGGANRLVNWNATTISVTMTCRTVAGGQTMAGIYQGRSGGAPIVVVSASVPYTPVLGSFGFSGIGLSLNATQQSAVMGI